MKEKPFQTIFLFLLYYWAYLVLETATYHIGCDHSLVILFSIQKILLCHGESYGCGIGIVGGRIGGWGIGNEGGADRDARNGSKDGLAASVAFRFITCPFLYTVIVMLFPAILC
jgi:hypothetical protein